MKSIKYVVLSMSLLLNSNVYSSEDSLWNAITSWPGCIVTTLTCCCFKICWNDVQQRRERERIARKYANRDWKRRFPEAAGVIKYDHSTGEWITINRSIPVPPPPTPPRPRRLETVWRTSPITGNTYSTLEYR